MSIPTRICLRNRCSRAIMQGDVPSFKRPRTTLACTGTAWLATNLAAMVEHERQASSQESVGGQPVRRNITRTMHV